MQKHQKKKNHGSGSITKNSQNGHFYLQYYGEGGRRKTITLKTPTGQHITEQRAAETAAREFMDRLKKIQDIENHEDYLEERARLKKLKARLTITLDDAFDLHLLKPHTRIASNQVENVNRRYWFDFVSFLHDRHGLTTLDQVERVHAEEYIAYIRKFGRWNRKISYHQEKCPRRKEFKEYESGGILSPTTLNRYQSVCKAVFSFLLFDLGYTLEENPFFHIKPLKLEPVERDIFTDEELQRIFASAPPLQRALFTLGICTGLRLGDVATLCWNEIDITVPDTNEKPEFFQHEIHRITRKTKTLVHIPIERELADFLSRQWEKSRYNEYVLPEAAEMYLNHKGMVNRRVLGYLHSLGIVTDKQVPGRKRKQSVKDFHSLRHCFCYYAGLRGVPLPVVQSIVGHLTAAMTRHYQSHADREARMKGIALMRGLFSEEEKPAEVVHSPLRDVLKDRIIQFADRATEIQLLQLNVIIDKLAANELHIETPQDQQIIDVKVLPETATA